ncbi:hypothetical protein PPL_09420 [Heterostelium album PN500]|uniref:Uncharacterized protein n=1 Tax=Heterostelium pallidum (strain ATCC 26659 / Pp 5 / PN500) TaxID=670386 RepID=D3BPF2_HETP5|nr:hypothetical protein PPL_09420 [Heterostelium album PN500]EFA76670.1 hypothetical protein PPL_09420 [Heterostelium album PN500]|eukprot:XP_020428802.1 hypothetical protein PPL_09420 [Heterostelium album PN500]
MIIFKSYTLTFPIDCDDSNDGIGHVIYQYKDNIEQEDNKQIVIYGSKKLSDERKHTAEECDDSNMVADEQLSSKKVIKMSDLLLFKEFSKLNTMDEDVIDETCMNIRSLFETAKRKGEKTLLLNDQLLPFIKLGIQHPSDQVQLTTIRQIQDTLNTERLPTLKWLAVNELLISLIPLLKSTTSVASSIIALFKEITNNNQKQQQQDNQEEILNQLLSNKLVTTINQFFEQSKSNRDEEQSALLRVLDIVVLLVNYHPLTMTVQLGEPLKYLVVAAVSDPDTLVRLGYVELVSRLGDNIDVLKWIIEQTEFIDSLARLLWKQLEDYHTLGIHYVPSEANVSVATQEIKKHIKFCFSQRGKMKKQ